MEYCKQIFYFIFRDHHDEDEHPRTDNPYMMYSETPHSQGYQHTLQSDQGYITNATSVSHGHPAHTTPIPRGHPVHSSQEGPVHDNVPEQDFRGDYQVAYKRREDQEESESEEEVPEVKEKRPKLEEGQDNTGIGPGIVIN